MKKILASIALSVLAFAGSTPASAGTGGSASTDLSAVEEDVGEIGSDGTEQKAFTTRLMISGGVDFTTNADQLGSNDDSDVLWIPALEAGINVDLGGGFGADAFVRMDSVLFSSNWDLSFWAISGGFYLDHRFKPEYPRFYVGCTPYYYQSWDSGDRLTEAIALRIGFDHGIRLNGDSTLLFYGYDFGQYWTSPSNDDRDTHRGTVGLLHRFQEKLYGTLFYQFLYSDFVTSGGEDKRHVAGCSLTYQLSRNISTSWHMNYAINDSNRPLGEYDTFTTGIQVTYRF